MCEWKKQVWVNSDPTQFLFSIFSSAIIQYYKYYYFNFIIIIIIVHPRWISFILVWIGTS